MKENNNLKEKMTSTPRSPGVYIMRDEQKKIIYVGKANDLKSRIGSYFTGKDARPMAPFLMSRVKDIDFITTATAAYPQETQQYRPVFRSLSVGLGGKRNPAFCAAGISATQLP
jgi:excinuclease UvrABC nuclease subunit